MTYTPVVPVTGYAGWAFLNRTIDSQKETFNESATMQRDTDYFRENIGSISSAEDLMNDRRLLTVALGAFGLGEDIDKTYFIQKILADGTSDPAALANNLSNSSYIALSEAFGFGEGETPDLGLIADDMVSRYQNMRFAEAIGEVDEDMQLALNVESALPDIATVDTTDNGLWYSILGDESVRSVFEVALGLPETIGTLDIDLQVSEFRKQSQRYFGDGEVSQFTDLEKRDELVRLFLARSEIANNGGGTSSAENALSLLSGR